jgi:hypothetical protein
MARVLTASGPRPVAVETMRQDIDDGAPTNPDGSVNLVHYAAWLVRRWDVAIDPRQLRPSDLCRLLNSTPLGEVISERQLRRHRMRAGFRIGDGQYVDLFRYVAWLMDLRHPHPKTARRARSYPHSETPFLPTAKKGLHVASVVAFHSKVIAAAAIARMGQPRSRRGPVGQQGESSLGEHWLSFRGE